MKSITILFLTIATLSIASANTSNSIQSLNSLSQKNLVINQMLTFPDRKGHETFARKAIDGKPYYWMVALSISNGEFIDVKEVQNKTSQPYCIFTFNLSDHEKYPTPYILNEGEVLALKKIEKAIIENKNIYYFHFNPPEYRFSLRCYMTNNTSMTIEDFEHITGGIFKLNLD